MPVMPPEYPYDPRAKVIFDGDTANHLVASAYNLQVVDGAYEPSARSPQLSLRKQPQAAYIKITHRLEDETGVYYKGDVYGYGLDLVSPPADNTVPAKHTGAIVLAMNSSGEWETGTEVGDWVVGVPSRAVISKIDMLTHWSITVSDVNDVKSYPIYLAVGGGGAGTIPAKITGAPVAGVYPISLYANGISEASTGSAEAAPLNLSIHETIPTNTWIIVTPGAYTEVESE